MLRNTNHQLDQEINDLAIAASKPYLFTQYGSRILATRPFLPVFTYEEVGIHQAMAGYRFIQRSGSLCTLETRDNCPSRCDEQIVRKDSMQDMPKLSLDDP